MSEMLESILATKPLSEDVLDRALLLPPGKDISFSTGMVFISRPVLRYKPRLDGSCTQP